MSSPEPIHYQGRPNPFEPLLTFIHAELNDGIHQRVWPHNDYGLLTLLFQDKVRGFGVEDRFKMRSLILI